MNQSKKQKSNQLIWLGTIVNTHGIKGELRVVSNSDDKNFYFDKNSIVYLKDGEKILEYKITSSRNHKNFILIFLSEIVNIEYAEKLKGKKIYILKEELTENDFYYKDAIGAQVIDQNDKFIGTVESFFNQKFYFSYQIKTSNNEEFNIPIIDEFITRFDKDKKILYVNLPEDFY